MSPYSKGSHIPHPPAQTPGAPWGSSGRPALPPPQPMGTLLRGFLLCHKSDVGHRGAVRALLCSAQCSQGKQSLHFSPIHALGKFAPQPPQAAPMEGLSPHSPALQSVPAKQSKANPLLPRRWEAKVLRLRGRGSVEKSLPSAPMGRRKGWLTSPKARDAIPKLEPRSQRCASKI